MWLKAICYLNNYEHIVFLFRPLSITFLYQVVKKILKMLLKKDFLIVMLVDTHCHINFIIKESYDSPLKDSDYKKAKNTIEQAKAESVTEIITVGTNLKDSLENIKIGSWFDSVHVSAGIHPTDCKATWKKDFQEIKKLIQNKEKNKIVAIGECGLDKYWPGYSLPNQIENFKYHIDLSIESNLPLIIHCREARDEMLEALQSFGKDAKGILHCFCNDKEYAQEVIKLGFLLGIGGPITYPKNNALRELIKSIDLEHIVLESDAPFLPPQIIRGKQNAPKYVKYVADFLAELYGLPLETVAKQTTQNAKKLFKLP